MKFATEPLDILAGKAHLAADLLSPPHSRGVVLLFFSGGGTQRLRSREAYVASAIGEAGFAVLLANLLTHGEDRLSSLRYNVKLLTQRIVSLTHWVREEARFLGQPVAYHATGAAAAAAIRAADRLGEIVRAIVIRSGRPDLAGSVPLAGVRAATLIIVGAADDEAEAPNRQAYQRLSCQREMLFVPEASQLFDEPGTLDFAARHAARWLARWMPLQDKDSNMNAGHADERHRSG